MRIWHYKLLPYLPDLQFKGQLRELVAIMRDWRDKGQTNHLLINRVMGYDKSELTSYFLMYEKEYYARYGKSLDKYRVEFFQFSPPRVSSKLFEGWHTNEYLRVCVANLYEKHIFGVGSSQITEQEWYRIRYCYKTVTGDYYNI